MPALRRFLAAVLPNNSKSVFRSRRDVDSEDFFEKISSIRIRYDDSEKKTIKEFKFSDDVVDGTIADQLWPTLGGWNVSHSIIHYSYGISHKIKCNFFAVTETFCVKITLEPMPTLRPYKGHVENQSCSCWIL